MDEEERFKLLHSIASRAAHVIEERLGPNAAFIQSFRQHATSRHPILAAHLHGDLKTARELLGRKDDKLASHLGFLMMELQTIQNIR